LKLRFINKSHSRKTFVVNIYSSEVFWVTGGLIRDAAKACQVNISWNITYNNKWHRINPKYFFLNKTKIDGALNIFIGHSIYFENESQSGNEKNIVIINQIQNEFEFEDKRKINLLNSSNKIILQNQVVKKFLINVGVKPNLMAVFPGAVDRSKFFPGFVKKDFVLVSGIFKPRKNPEFILRVIQGNPSINFIIHGENLDYFKNYAKNSYNLKLIKWKKTIHPKLMKDASVFMNLSFIEGGPISILEALSVGTPVIATDTGFAKELIEKEFGSVIPMNCNLSFITSELNKWLGYSKKHIPCDFLKGEFSFADYGLILFNLQNN